MSQELVCNLNKYCICIVQIVNKKKCEYYLMAKTVLMQILKRVRYHS